MAQSLTLFQHRDTRHLAVFWMLEAECAFSIFVTEPMAGPVVTGYGGASHGGFEAGLERLVAWVGGIKT